MVIAAALNTNFTQIENIIAEIINLVTNAALNTKAIQIENEISNITDLTTRTVLISEMTTETKDLAKKNRYKDFPQFRKRKLKKIG